MLERIRNKRKEKKGFTLLELIIVIAIIAILLALLVPNLTKFLGTAKTTANEANAKTIYTSAASWASGLAAKDVALTKDTAITVSGDAAASATGGTVGAADLTELDKYVKDGLGDGSAVITIGDDYSIASVVYTSASGATATYDGKKATTPANP